MRYCPPLRPAAATALVEELATDAVGVSPDDCAGGRFGDEDLGDAVEGGVGAATNLGAARTEHHRPWQTQALRTVAGGDGGHADLGEPGLRGIDQCAGGWLTCAGRERVGGGLATACSRIS